jgi:FAD/FMN-containing dehydrogenase
MHGEKNIPLSAHELRDAVRHRQHFDASRLNRILRHEEDRGVVEVQASATWTAIAAHVRPGDAQAAAASLRTTMPTIGESIAANSAGPDGRPAVAHVDSITLITLEGELRKISRLSHRELFSLVVGGQGLFGTIYSVNLRIDSLARAVNEAAGAQAPAAVPACGSRPLHLLVPPEALERFVADAHARCDEWRIALQGVDVRAVLPEEETFLRWARRRYSEVALRFAALQTIGGAVRDTQLRQELIGAAIDAGGSFPIARTPDATREQVAACYPELPEFLAEKRRVDPGEKLVNSWYLHHRSLFSRQACEVRFAQA